MTIVENRTVTVTGGVDTHLDFHVAAAIDSNGGVLGVETFDTTTGGYRNLVRWLAGFGTISLVGVEGTGSYGAGLTRHLTGKGIRVVEVDRPNRQARHRAGKTDAIDAISAARAALTGTATGVPKSRTGNIEAIRVLTIARRSAANEWIAILNQIRHVTFTAPDEISARRQSPWSAPPQRCGRGALTPTSCATQPCRRCVNSAGAHCFCGSRRCVSTLRCDP